MPSDGAMRGPWRWRWTCDDGDQAPTWKRRKRKTKTKKIKAKVSNRFLFWHSRHHRGCKCV